MGLCLASRFVAGHAAGMGSAGVRASPASHAVEDRTRQIKTHDSNARRVRDFVGRANGQAGSPDRGRALLSRVSSPAAVRAAVGALYPSASGGGDQVAA
jgi:hypothetical protein